MSEMDEMLEDFEDLLMLDGGDTHYFEPYDSLPLSVNRFQRNHSSFSFGGNLPVENHVMNSCKLFVEIPSISGLPTAPNNLFGTSKYFIRMELNKQITLIPFHSPILSPATNDSPLFSSVSHCKSTQNPFHFDIDDYFGPSRLKFTLIRKSFMKETTLCRGSITLAELFAQQDTYFAQRQVSTDNSVSSLYSIPWQIEYILSIPITEKSEEKTNSGGNWCKNAFGCVDISTVASAYPNNRSSLSLNQTGNSVYIHLHLKFRVINIYKCLHNVYTFNGSSPVVSLRTVPQTVWNTSLPSATAVDHQTPRHQISEFHLLITCGSEYILIELLKYFVFKKILSRVLSLRSSEGYSALDFVLLSGNHSNLCTLLQRAGNLCFQNIPQKAHTSPLHSAVIGPNPMCLKSLLKFLLKYSNKPSRPQQSSSVRSQHWSPLYQELINWKDSQDGTPLVYCCALEDKAVQLDLLLQTQQCEIAYANAQTGYTPLMYACLYQRTPIVRILLSLVQPHPFTTHSSGSSRRESTLLTQHIRSNSHSRNLLTSSSLSHGGYYNPMNQYLSNPTARDDMSRQALHIASLQNNAETLHLLLEIGVSVINTDALHRSVFHFIAEYNYIDQFREIIKYEDREYQMYKDLNRYETMLTRRRGLLICDYRGRTAIHICYERKHFELCLLMLLACATIYSAADVDRDFPIFRLWRDILASREDSTEGTEKEGREEERRTAEKKNSNELSPGNFYSLAPQVSSSGISNQEEGEEPTINDSFIDDFADETEYFMALVTEPKYRTEASAPPTLSSSSSSQINQVVNFDFSSFKTLDKEEEEEKKNDEVFEARSFREETEESMFKSESIKEYGFAYETGKGGECDDAVAKLSHV